MGLRIVLFAAVLSTLVGCAVTQPPEPTSTDADQLLALQLEAVWDDTGLDDSLRPEAVPVETSDTGFLGLDFARCMMDRGWAPDYFADASSGSWRSLSEATSDDERLDWYECFASRPTTLIAGFESVERYDFVYDYYQEFLIPCLEGNGYHVLRAPSRSEFRASAGSEGLEFMPFVWNPYFALPEFSAAGAPGLAEMCPPQPPAQDYYQFD